MPGPMKGDGAFVYGLTIFCQEENHRRNGTDDKYFCAFRPGVLGLRRPTFVRVKVPISSKFLFSYLILYITQ